MKVDVNEIDDVQRELKFEVSKERVSQGLEEVYKDLGRKAKIKGFRPGKAPRKVLEKYYEGTAQNELVKKIIPEIYQEGIQKENIHPIAMPEIGDVDYKDGVITFKATVDIKPEIKIDGYKGIKVKRKSSEVSEEEINKTLEYFKKGQGQDKEIEIDDGFAKSLGYPSLEEFKKSLVKQLEVDKDRRNKADIENQIVEALVKKAKFTVPRSLVKQQIEHAIQYQIEQLRRQGLSEEEITKKVETLKEELKEPSERQVKAYLILSKIAELEKIELQEKDNLFHKVVEFLLKEAKWEEK